MFFKYTAEELENVTKFFGIFRNQSYFEKKETNYSNAETLNSNVALPARVNFNYYFAFYDLILDGLTDVKNGFSVFRATVCGFCLKCIE